MGKETINKWMRKMYYEENRTGILDERGWEEHSLDEMGGEDLSEKAIMVKGLIVLSNPCPPSMYVCWS